MCIYCMAYIHISLIYIYIYIVHKWSTTHRVLTEARWALVSFILCSKNNIENFVKKQVRIGTSKTCLTFISRQQIGKLKRSNIMEKQNILISILQMSKSDLGFVTFFVSFDFIFFQIIYVILISFSFQYNFIVFAWFNNLYILEDGKRVYNNRVFCNMDVDGKDGELGDPPIKILCPTSFHKNVKT